MSIGEKLTTIAENQQKVFDAGFDKGTYDRDLQIWKAITMNGTRHNDSNGYYRAFQRTDFTGYTFVKPVAPKGSNSCDGMFYEYMGTHLPKNLDLSGLSPSANIGGIFSWATSLLEIYDIGLPAMNSYSWSNSYNVKKIEILRVHEGTGFGLSTLSALEEITFEGVIGKNLNLSSSTKLKYESLMNIIGCLKDYSEDTSGTTHTLTIGTTNQNKLSAAEKAIVTQKGWTLA